jgi:V/A-type H+-transporting ATPase subunit D
MTHTLHVPPGRAGQLWLRHRAAVADRAVDLLDQKLRLLRAERQRCALDEQRTRAAWEQACADADAWVLRLAELGGQRAIRLGAAPTPADVAVRWGQVVGVWYPAGVDVHEPDLAAAPGGSATLVEARRRVGVALAAAARHAAARAALRVLTAQEAGTRRRLRSIRTRYLPLLAETRRRVELALEEDERSDLLRLRWAAARGVSTHDQR